MRVALVGPRTFFRCGEQRAHGVVVSRLLRMQKALGSNPSGSNLFLLEQKKSPLHFFSCTGRT
jgi:hypothetical protein